MHENSLSFSLSLSPFLFLSLSLSGCLEMDLNHMLRPAKSPEKCGLELLSQPQDKLVSLFEQKTVKGWWPCVCDRQGEKILAVIKAQDTCKHISPYMP